MQTWREAQLGTATALRRQLTQLPVPTGRPEDSYPCLRSSAPAVVIINPSLGYADVSPMLQRLRGPYWLAPGVDAYERHLEWHTEHRPGPVITLMTPP
jgi:hypothetical protein